MDYSSIRERCFAQRRLFEDPDFPAAESSIFKKERPPHNLVWRRPFELSKSPHFIKDDVCRFDVNQGFLLDCWVVASIASLCQHKHLFDHVVIPGQSFERGRYCGVFRFRFWRFGKWKEVIVDDRLPTYNGKLYFAKSSDQDEYWCALVEKAYAKVCGSYESMNLGKSSEALQDFTGGVTIAIPLDKPPQAYMKTLPIIFEYHSLLAASITPPKGTSGIENRLPNGLVQGHAYTVTGINTKVQLHNATPVQSTLVRLRNPWGNAQEWKGPWSDGSREWKLLSEEERRKWDVRVEHDGEFWMSMEDFVREFSALDICFLSPEMSYTDTKKRWQAVRETGSWIKGVTAGGCRNNLDTFHINPQYRVELKEADDESDLCTLIVALMRIDRRRTFEGVPIGYAIYRVPDGYPTEHLDRHFFQTTMSVAKTNTFTRDREITTRQLLPVGSYVIIPSTFAVGEEADYLLRIYSFKNHQAKEIDENTTIPTEPKPQLTKEEENVIDHNFKRKFYQTAGEDGEVDQYELQQLLSTCFRKDLNNNLFSLEACRSLIAMFDYDLTGGLGFKEFRVLWKMLTKWREVLYEYDHSRDGDISIYALRDALRALGYRLSNHTLKAITMRYNNKRGMLSFDILVQIIVTITRTFDHFSKHMEPGTKKAVFDIDDYVICSLSV